MPAPRNRVLQLLELSSHASAPQRKSPALRLSLAPRVLSVLRCRGTRACSLGWRERRRRDCGRALLVVSGLDHRGKIKKIHRTYVHGVQTGLTEKPVERKIRAESELLR